METSDRRRRCDPCIERTVHAHNRRRNPGVQPAVRHTTPEARIEARQQSRLRSLQKRKAEKAASRPDRERLKAEAKARRDAARLAKRAAVEADKLAKQIAKPWTGPGLTNRERIRLKRAHSPEFRAYERARIKSRPRRDLRNLDYALRRGLRGDGDFTGYAKVLGYDAAALKAHLESLFTEGMDWAKFHAGLIHIDHVLPLVLFDFADDEGVREAYALSNLQPLWAHENLRKGATHEGGGSARADQGRPALA
jgi:hypothetical protein